MKEKQGAGAAHHECGTAKTMLCPAEEIQPLIEWNTIRAVAGENVERSSDFIDILHDQVVQTLISEEVAAKKQTLHEIASSLADVIEKRDRLKKNYGVILIPEGLIEFIPEMKTLIGELNTLLADGKGSEEKLSAESKKTLDYLPKELEEQLLLDRDPHGNVQVSHIQTEVLLSHVVKKELEKRGFKGKFNPLHHFLGYEGRAGYPTNFDATYCYSLGLLAALLIQRELTGYMSCITHLSQPPEKWELKAVPITSLMTVEMRKGKEKPVIEKALVDLEGPAFKAFERHRAKWMEEEHYQFVGPIQFEGEPELTFQVPRIVKQT